MKKLTSNSFKNLIIDIETSEIKIKKPSIIKFFIDNCEGCEIMKPIFEYLEKDCINIDFFEMKAGSDIEVAKKFNIINLPAFVVIKTNGQFIKIEGQMPKVVLLNQMLNFLDN